MMASGLIDIATKIKPASAAAPPPTMTKKLLHGSNMKCASLIFEFQDEHRAGTFFAIAAVAANCQGSETCGKSTPTLILPYDVRCAFGTQVSALRGIYVYAIP